MDHLTPELMSRWRAGALDAKETLMVSDHLAACEPCRARLRGARTLEQSAGALQRQLAGELAGAHLRGAELVALADGSAPAALRMTAMAHLDACAMCRAELDDLRRFAAEDRATRAPRRRLIVAVAAAAVVLVAIGAGAWLVGRSAGEPAALVTLRDATGAIVLRADGSVRGAPEPFAAAVAGLLRDPTALALPDAALAVARQVERQRTGTTETPSVAILAPASSIELEEHPLFRWSGPAGAEYSVAVFDSRFDRVDASGPLTTDQWRARATLPRDELLTWTVEATIDGRKRTFPAPPQPPAVFRIASTAQVARVETARASGSHLLLAQALWDAGRVEQAATEFARLRALNPDSTVARDLASGSERAVARLRATPPDE